MFVLPAIQQTPRPPISISLAGFSWRKTMRPPPPSTGTSCANLSREHTRHSPDTRALVGVFPLVSPPDRYRRDIHNGYVRGLVLHRAIITPAPIEPASGAPSRHGLPTFLTRQPKFPRTPYR